MTTPILNKLLPDDIAGRRLLNEQQAAAFLGTTPGSLNNLRVRNKRDGSGPALPHIKLGRSIRYRLSDLEAYLAANTYGGGNRQAAAQ